MDRYVLKLYITGLTSRSQRAVATLQRLCDSELAGRYELVVVDVLEQPELAEQDKVLATPTVIKEHPEPQRRIIGDLSDAARVLAALDLNDGETHAPLTDTRVKEAD
ncbi:circadian clock KaiB family protein [Tautonia rosea]|uniref:circadian clock KaiB family protein n=1 Tax=Tautonia rosea TaxID=2728037 RepID=UPI0014756DAC|nr:circadian clock KaiB family protein [Tautonia rosea]